MAAPELRLEVSLNLLGFRNEIRKLTNIAQSEFAPKINVKFNRQTLDAELNNLQRAIKRRAYRVEIGGNIDALPGKIKNLKEQLASIESLKIDLGIGAVKSFSKKDASKIKSDLRAEILGEQKKLYIPTSIQAKISRDDIRDFKNAVKSKLTGLSVDVKVNAKGGGFAGSEQGAAGLMQYMRSQGMVGKTASGMEMRLGKGGDDIKQQLSDAVQSAEKIKSVFDGVAKNIATTGKSIANVQGKRLSLANVPLIAGSVEKKVERSAEAIGGTMSPDALKALYPEINKTIASFASLKGQIQQNTSKLSGFSLIIGLAAFAGVPLAKSIVKLTGSTDNFAKLLDKLGPKLEAAFAKATSSILNAASSRLLSGGRSAGMLPPAYRGIGPAANPAGLLPPAYRGIMPARETAGLLGAAPAPAGLLPSVTFRGAMGEMMRQLTGGIAPPSSGGGDDAGKLAMSPRNLKERVDAILRDYFKVVEVEIRETFNAPRAIKAQLSQFDALFVQAFDDIQNTIRQVFDTSRKAADKVAKQNQIDVAIQSFVAALETIVRNAERNAFAQSRIAANKSYVQKANVREVGQPLLEPSRIAGLLPGRASAASVLELNNILAGAIREYFKAVARDLEAGGKAPLSARPLLPSASPRNPPLLPPVGGTSGSIRISTGAYVGQPGFMQAPSMPSVSRQPLTGQSTPLASPLGSGYFAVGKGLKDIQSAYGQAKRFLDTSRFPVAGAITELGSEFGNAIKQVLLFGTAYKALAFLTSLPREAFNAAKGLATYRNQLQAVTEATGTFDQSLAFVDNLANRFNVPLTSAREGFVKLFASMQPAGFDQGQIENLFTGISKAAATFGLSADKVDRVNYAFAQMASKGQIMSEELKGQLGDVLPGALSLFADAAQMSVPEFSKAMEDGAFKGKAMEQVLDNVAILLNTKFGPSAQGAAKTLQGAVNQIQNNLTLMYESFGPIVDAAAAAFGPQINSLIKDVAETMKVLTGTFTQAGEGFDTLSPRAQAFYAAIQTLRPSLEQAGAALADLGGRLASLLPLFVQVISSAISLASSPLGRGAIIAATAIGILTAALKLLEVTGLKAALKAVYAFIGGLLKIPAATGVARVAIIGLKLALTGVFVGAILMGLDLLIGKLFNIGDAANDSAKDILGMRKELDAMAGAGDIESTSKAYLDANTKLAAARKANQKALNDLRAAKARPEGDTQADINKGVAVANAQTKVDQTYAKVIEAQKEVQTARRSRASAVSVKEQQEEQAQAALQEIDLSAGDGTGKPPKEQSLESYYSLQDTLAKNAADFAAAQTEEEFRHKIELLEMYYDIQETRANAYQKDAIKFEREMVMIEARRQEARLKAQLDVQRAQSSVAGGAGGGEGKGLGAGIAQYITGDPSSPFYRADHGGGNYHEHLAFVSRQAAEEAYKKLTSAGIQVTEFKGKSRVGRHTPGSAHYEGLAFDVPGAQVPVGRERELTARVQSTLGIGGARPAPVPASQKRDVVAEQKTLQASIDKTTTERMADARAVQEQIVALEKYRTTAFPTIEQETQNKLLAKRNELFRSGMTDEQIDKEIKLYENQERGTAALAAVQRLYDGNIIKLDKYNELMAIFNRDIATQNTLLQENANALAQAKFDQTIKGIRDQLAMARSLTPDQELRTSIEQQGFTGERAETLFQEEKMLQGAQKLKADLQGIAGAIGDSFGEAFKGMISGSMTAQQALANLFQSVGNYFADMVAKMIAEWLKAQLIKGFANLFGSIFGGGGGDPGGKAVGTGQGIFTAANGGIAYGGFRAFANGGVVSGPTMGLVGEGSYNEAIVPLPDGKSIPVQLAGGDGGNQIISNITVNVNNGQAQSNATGSNSSEMGRKIEGAVKQVIVGELRPGGLLASKK
jgi:tape measure domain-containing protein